MSFYFLEGSSKVSLPPLEPDIKSFISFIPYAIDMAFFRPHVTEVKNISYIPDIIENVIFLILVFISIFSTNKKIKTEPVIFFSFFLFCINIVVIGLHYSFYRCYGKI